MAKGLVSLDKPREVPYPGSSTDRVYFTSDRVQASLCPSKRPRSALLCPAKLCQYVATLRAWQVEAPVFLIVLFVHRTEHVKVTLNLN
ncbi:hypothetical protein RRG08_016985 [Elysia crispata]|uniref:Uncharacterized protein n=1 Tax=Elysia crispata TaxID=231223 RepID=A0AAE1CQ57_9GAST|nr:hypothetical protein RRG08_016985 [Elysia crispata]